MKENDNIPQAQFQFVNYIVKDCRIQQSGQPISDKMQFSINPVGDLNKKENIFELTLTVNVHDPEKNFILDMMIMGVFSYQATDMNTLINFISCNSPAIIFPYIRAYVSSISCLSGCSTIIMPTLNMKQVGDVLKEQMKKYL